MMASFQVYGERLGDYLAVTLSLLIWIYGMRPENST
jgi:hypothetical protein